MKKLLAILPAAALLAVLSPGCGDTCSTAPTEVQPTTSANCNGVGIPAAGATITVNARPTCQSCAQSSPTCDISEAGGQEVFVDVKVQECDKDKGCGSASCSFGAVSCTYRVNPSFSGTLRVTYRTGGSTASEDLTIGGGDTTSCTL